MVELVHPDGEAWQQASGMMAREEKLRVHL